MNALLNQETNATVSSAVIPIEDDEALITMVAMFLKGIVSQNGRTMLRKLGWPDAVIADLDTMPISDVAKALGGHNACVSLMLNQQKIATVLNAYKANQRDQQELEYFIKHAAPPSLIRLLFPSVTVRMLKAQRKQLCNNGLGGRPRLPDFDTAEAVLQQWALLGASEANLRKRYLRLHESFSALSLATLNAIVNER